MIQSFRQEKVATLLANNAENINANSEIIKQLRVNYVKLKETPKRYTYYCIPQMKPETNYRLCLLNYILRVVNIPIRKLKQSCYNYVFNLPSFNASKRSYT